MPEQPTDETPTRPACKAAADCEKPTLCLVLPAEAREKGLAYPPSITAERICDTDTDSNGKPDIVDHGWVLCGYYESETAASPCFKVGS